MNYRILLVAAVSMALLGFASGCGSGAQVTGAGFETTDTGWTGDAGFILPPDAGTPGIAAGVEMTRDGERTEGDLLLAVDSDSVDVTAEISVDAAPADNAVGISLLIDERTIDVDAAWGDGTEVGICFDDAELPGRLCGVLTPAYQGEQGSVCGSVSGFQLPCALFGGDGEDESGAIPVDGQGASPPGSVVVPDEPVIGFNEESGASDPG